MPTSPLEAAVLTLVRRDPDLSERTLARALADIGATQGCVYRILQRHGLGAREQRQAWAAAGGDAAARSAPAPTPAAIASISTRLAGLDAGLEPLYRYHLAAAWCRIREGAAVPGVGGAGAVAR